VPEHPSLDPITEARRQWSDRWPDQADRMAAVTSVMRVQQLLLARIEDILKPFGLTFAAYEALRLLAFTRTGSMPMGKMGTRLMVHPAAVTNAISKLEQRGLVRRSMSPEDRRVVLATITDDGRSLADESTAALNEAAFGLPGLSRGQAAELVGMLREVRALTGDLDAGAEPAPSRLGAPRATARLIPAREPKGTSRSCDSPPPAWLTPPCWMRCRRCAVIEAASSRRHDCVGAFPCRCG
jgi:DNA-binding MarR family transcriptional regulator